MQAPTPYMHTHRMLMLATHHNHPSTLSTNFPRWSTGKSSPGSGWHRHSWRMNACNANGWASHMHDRLGTGSPNQFSSAAGSSGYPSQYAFQTTMVAADVPSAHCIVSPADNYVVSEMYEQYKDEYTLPCSFPNLPLAKMVDHLVWLTELGEL